MNDKYNEPVEIDEDNLQQTIARVVKGEGSEEDKNFIKELEKALGEPIIDGKLKMLGEKIKANKEAMATYELEAKTKLAENELEKQRRLSESDKHYQRELSELERQHQIRQDLLSIKIQIVELHATVYSKSKWFIGILLAILAVLIFIATK